MPKIFTNTSLSSLDELKLRRPQMNSPEYHERAIEVLKEQLGTAQSPNRVAKLQARIKHHEIKLGIKQGGEAA